MNITSGDLRLYMHCPRAYQLSKTVEKKPTLSMAKAGIARFVIRAGNISFFDLAWGSGTSRVDEKELGKQVTKKETKEQREKKKLREQLSNFFAIEKQETVAQEISYEFDLLDFAFSGIIDQIRHIEGKTTIWQFSTSSQVPPEVYLQRNFYISLACYAAWKGKLVDASLEEKKEINIGVIPDCYVYHLSALETLKKKCKGREKGDLKGNPLIPAMRSEQFLLDFEYELLQVAGMIQAGYFPMMPAHPRCNLCRYSKECKSDLVSENNNEIEDF